MEQEVKIVHLYDRQPPEVNIKLEKNSKGYNWEISYRGENLDEVLAKIREANNKLQAEYGN
jgi:hypothetical protein